MKFKYSKIILSILLMFALAMPAYAGTSASAVSNSAAGATATANPVANANAVNGGQNTVVGGQNTVVGGQTLVDGGNTLTTNYSTSLGLSSGGNSMSVSSQGSEVPRNFGIPYPLPFVNTPSEFLNDTGFANVQPVKFILSYGFTFTKAQLKEMKSGGSVKILQSTNLYGKSGDAGQIIFLTEIPKGMSTKKIGAIVAKGNNGNTTTEQILGRIGLEALSIEGAKYVLVTGEGMQKRTEASAWGIALGYTAAGISGETGNTFQTGAVGIGYSSGSAGRTAAAFIHAVVLTDGQPIVVVPVPVAVVKVAPQAKAEVPVTVTLKLEDVHFLNNSATLTPEAKGILARDIQLLKSNPKVPVRIEGYTSKPGTDAYNQVLSQKRAATVQAYLIEKGISKDRLSTIGYGKTKATGNAKEDRKVIFVILAK